MFNKFALASLVAFQTASASVQDYYFGNQDDGLLTQTIAAFSDNGGTAAMPTETTLFTWTSNYYGLTHIVANVTPRMVRDLVNPPINTTLRGVLINTTTMEEYCSFAFEGPMPFAAPEWDSCGCSFTGLITDG